MAFLFSLIRELFVDSKVCCRKKRSRVWRLPSAPVSSSTASKADFTRMESLLRSQANTEGGAYSLWYAMRAEGAPRNDAMEQMLVSGLTGRRGDYFLDKITTGALAGNTDAIRLLGKALEQDGMEPEKTERCFDVLRQAAKNGHADAVVKTLLEQHARFGDNGDLLNCLGAIAQDGKLSKQNATAITELLRREVASADPDAPKRCQRFYASLFLVDRFGFAPSCRQCQSYYSSRSQGCSEFCKSCKCEEARSSA